MFKVKKSIKFGARLAGAGAARLRS